MTRPLVQIEVAPAAYEFHADPAVISVHSGHRALLALFDGVGSWGSGMEAAAWTRVRLEERWRHSLPESISAAVEEIVAVSDDVPKDFRDADFGCGFCGVAILLHGTSMHVAAAGLFGVYLASQSQLAPIFKPHMLTDQLVEAGQLSPHETDSFAHQDVCIGPFLVDGGRQALECSGPHEMLPGHLLIATHHRHLRFLTTMPPASWMSRSAAELQRAAAQAGMPAYPTILIRRGDANAAIPRSHTPTEGAA